MKNNEINHEQDISYSKKVWIKGSIYALIVILILVFKATFSVFLLILAGGLIALFFTGVSDLICRKTKWKEWLCLTISVVGILLLIIAMFWLIGSKVQSQISQLTDALPQTVENAKATISQHSIGKKLVDKLSSPESMNKAKGLAETFFKTTFGVFGDIYIILFIGIFFTVSPKVYTRGVIKLIPPGGKEKGGEVLDKLGTNLKKWLKGKIFAMFIVFVLTAIGLAIIDLPMLLTLALVAGILNFIPNFGPLIAMIPAVLIALLQGLPTAAIVVGLYLLIQFVESNFITPMVQQKLVSIPPALIIIAQLLISPLAGGWGLVLATPLMLIIIVIVQELYIKKQQPE